ncbi:MAG: hypothetical protein KAU10_04260, partial [Dehalococcoidia bacterium]|nr:hypothetical protein [Dehalococcoidia bacterium]
DFDDDNYEFFVGVSDGNFGGSVYRVDDAHAYCLGKEDGDIKDKDVVSLDVVGSFGATSLIAGTRGTSTGTDDKVIYSTDDGDSWADASKDPSGDDKAFVIMDEDFDDSGIAWAACEGEDSDDGAVSLTVDGGDMWNQISLISIDISTVRSLSFSPDYLTDETMFLLTDGWGVTSLWRNDGDNWERVFTSTLTTPALGWIDKVGVSPEFSTDETIYVVGLGPSPVFYRSTDGGNDWDALSNQPPELLRAAVVVDSDTVLAAAPGHVYYTTNHGRRAWEDESVSDLSFATSFRVSPNFASDDTILLGDITGQIFISEDIGESWDQVGDAILTSPAQTIVAFDVNYGTNGTIYAAAGDEVDRCVIDTDEDWADQEWKEFTTAKTELDMGTASGLRCSADGTLYATDATAASDNVGGAWRSLNPTADMGDVVFEQMETDFELDAGVHLKSLHLTAGSNTLWSVNVGTAELWQYEDFLATEVMLDEPGNGAGLDDTDQAWLEWKELNGADDYQLKWTDNADFDVHVTTVSDIDELDYLLESLDDGTAYYW